MLVRLFGQQIATFPSGMQTIPTMAGVALRPRQPATARAKCFRITVKYQGK